MKLHHTPFCWLVIGYLTGWVHAKPSLFLSLVWGAVLYVTIIAYMRDIEVVPETSE